MKRILFMTIIAAAAVSLCHSAEGRTILSCDFEGKFNKNSHGDYVYQNCINNYEWGIKDISLVIGTDGKNKSQGFKIRGISSGQLQFFIKGVKLWRNKYYKVTFRAKGELAGEVTAKVRRVGSPWKTFIKGIRFTPEAEWKEYSFIGKSEVDLDSDIAILFATGALGEFYIDDVKLEEFNEDPGSNLKNTNPLVKGNIVTRSSVEGQRDYFWTSGIHAGPNGEWEDPQIRREDGGKFGKYALLIPSPTTEGTSFTRSAWIPVASNTRYTLSFYLKANKPGAKITAQIYAKQDNKKLTQKKFSITGEWQRYSLSTEEIPENVSDVYISFLTNKGIGGFLLDGVQLEAGTSPTPYKPAKPYELYARMDGFKSNIVYWGEPIKLYLYAGSALDNSTKKSIDTRVKVIDVHGNELSSHELSLEINKQSSYTLPVTANGIFRVELEPLEPEMAAAQQIITARLPKPRETGKASSFGAHISIRPFFIDYAKKIGMKWVRLHDASLITKWKGVEKTPGNYEYYDTQVDATVAAGLNILGLPDYPTKWALANGKKEGTYVDLPAFRELCKRLANHYKGRIDYWEVWNEPYMKYFFSGTMEQFDRIFTAGAEGFREGNAGCTIIGFCTELSGVPFAKNVPEQTRKTIDILSVHSYFTNLPGGGTADISQEVQHYLDFLAPFKPREIWNTEGNNPQYAATTQYSFMNVNEKYNQQAAAFASRVLIEQIKGGIDKFFVYTLHQSDTIMYHKHYNTLIGFDRTITPPAVANAVTAWCIDAMPAVTTQAHKGIVQGLFTDGKRSTWAVFDDSAVLGSMTLDTTKLPAGVKVYDLMGNELTSGKAHSIGIMPYFAVSTALPAQELATTCRAAVK